MRFRALHWIATLTGVGGVALMCAHSVRYDLIEPGSVGAFCEASPTHWRCLIRQAFLGLLTDQWLGWLSIAMAVLSLIFGASALGWCAWFVASAGFVLYNAELAAPALLLAGVALTRARQRANNRGRCERQPTASER